MDNQDNLVGRQLTDEEYERELERERRSGRSTTVSESEPSFLLPLLIIGIVMVGLAAGQIMTEFFGRY